LLPYKEQFLPDRQKQLPITGKIEKQRLQKFAV